MPTGKTNYSRAVSDGITVMKTALIKEVHNA